MIFFLPFLGLSLILCFLAYSYSFISLAGFLVLLFTFIIKKQKERMAALILGGLIGIIIYFLIDFSPTGTLNQIGIITKSETNYFLIRTLKGCFYVKYKSNPYEVGDIIKINGTLEDFSFTHFQESFDFATYLKSFGAFKSVTQFTIQNKYSNIIRIKAFQNYLLEGYSSESKTLIGGLVFGNSINDLSSYHSLKDIGISNLLSCSGIHLGFLQMMVNKLLENKVKEKPLAIINFSFMFIMFIVTGFSLSLFRLVIVNLITLLYRLKKIGYISYVEKISIAGFIILLIHPLYVLNIGFFYTFPVLIFFGFLRSFISRREKWKRLRMSFCFGLTLIPLNMFTTYAISPLAIILQFILSPLLSLTFCLDLLVFFKDLTRPFLDRINYIVIQGLSLSSNLDFQLVSGKVSIWIPIVYFSLLLITMLLKNYTFKKGYTVSFILMMVICSCCFIPDFSSHYEVHFIDVGQGDSTLIRYGKYNIVIDTGGSNYNDLARECLIPYFNRLKIRKLDAVLTTHDDFDHVGALDNLKSNFPISNIYKGGEKESVTFGDLKITDINTFKVDGGESNYNSAVYSFKISSTDFLIMGDAPIAIEKRIIEAYPDLECDVIKLGHHGSNTSSCQEFLKFVSPEVAVISVGLNNIYKHPSKSVITELNSLSINYVRTDLNGTFIYAV